MSAPIIDAGSRLLDQGVGTLPDVSSALLDWFQPLTFRKLTKAVVAFQNVETATDICTSGVIQPFTAKQLLLKPEGQRAFPWLMIHTLPGCALEVDDIVVQVDLRAGNTPFRVMAKKDYSAYGYVEYHVVQGFDGDLA